MSATSQNNLSDPWVYTIRYLWAVWTNPIRAEPLALFRILLGLTTLAALLTGIAWQLVRTCGPDGIVPLESNDVWLARSGRMCLLNGPVSIPLLTDWLPGEMAARYPWAHSWLGPEAAEKWREWGARPESAYLLFGLFLASLVGVATGTCTRLSALVALVMAITFHNRLPCMMNGGDGLFRTGLYFLVLAPAGACWSVDAVLRRRVQTWLGRPAPARPVMIAPWSVRLMQIQVCVMYLFTGLVKCGQDYFSGVALYWVLNDVAITRWPYHVLPVPLIICRLLSWGTLAFELGFGLFVLSRWLRPWVLLAGVCLHLGILLHMEIGWFSQVALCWYVLFLRGETVAGAAAWLGRRFRRAPGRAAGTPRTVPRVNGILAKPPLEAAKGV